MNKKIIAFQFVLCYLMFIGISGLFFDDTVNASIDLTNDIVAHYHLNENSGINAYDSSGNNYNGTLKNMENSDWVTGKLNNCLEFDGNLQYVELSNSNILVFERTDSFSLECWFKKGTESRLEFLIGKTKNSQGYRIYFHNRYTQFVISHHAYNRIHKETINRFDDNNWHHIIATYDGSSTVDGMNIYIDNINQPTRIIRNDLTYNILKDTKFKFATTGDLQPTTFFIGNIDEIVIYNKELSQSEVDFRYNNGSGRENMTDILPCNNTCNENPIDNSEILCNNLKQLCADINFSNGIGYYVNITLMHDGNITYNNDTSNITNSTYCLNVSNVNFTKGTCYYWWVNKSSDCGTFNTLFNFTCRNDTELEIIIKKLDTIIENLEGDDVIIIDTTQFVISIQIVLFILFMLIGYTIPSMEGNKRTFHYLPFSGGLFVIFGALDFISLSITLNIYNLGIISGFLTTIGIILLIIGILKAFYYE